MFEGKTIIVTGATKGLGRQLALEMGRRGANVACVARTRSDLEQLAVEVHDAGGSAEPIACDVSDPAQVDAMAELVLKRFGQVDMLVNNAGIQGVIDWVVNFDPAEWDRIMAVNLRGPFLCARAVLPGMIARRAGKIVNVAAGVGEERVDYGVAAYYASKAGLVNFTRQLAAEVKRYRIFVNAIDPGGLTTGMSDEIMEVESQSDEFDGSQTNKNPSIRLRHPKDIVPMLIFLLSDQSDMMTGRLLQASSRDDVQYLQL
jgi:NAD(P)-dependent dehydrogenase (short-subunit alcohol dehydrogenase family)